MSWKEYGLNSYQDYLQTKHWKELREELLWKRDSNCYICENWVNLLPHHIRYDNLFKEKLYRDIFILCSNCHTLVHFWFFGMIKTPLKPFWLLLSVRLRKLLFCVQYRRFGAFLLWFLIILVSIVGELINLLLKIIFKIFSKLFWWILKHSLSKINIDIQ